MRKVWIVTKYTFKDIVSSKILYVAAFLGLSTFLISLFASELSYGVSDRIALDFGLGLLSFVLPAIAIFYGVSILSNDIEQRTIYMTITRSVKRYEYFLGKCLGLMLSMAIIQGILALFTIQSFFLLGGKFSSLILWSLLFGYIEACLIFVLALNVSLIANLALSISFSIIFFFISHAISASHNLGYVKARPLLAKVLSGFHYIFPELDKLNIKSYLLYSQDLPTGLLLGNTVYGVLYIVGLFFIGIFIFSKKELE